jgi:hypothetical protein
VALNDPEWDRPRQWIRSNEMRIATLNVGTLCLQTGVTECKIASQKERPKNEAGWEKPVKKTKVRIGL